MKMGIMSLWRRGGDTKLRYCRLRFHSVHYCIECPPSPHHQHHPRTAPRLRTTALLRCRPSERLDAASQRPLVALRPQQENTVGDQTFHNLPLELKFKTCENIN
ncbi:hypothetical protein J6590_104092, partial [Homalodisca vitripennis]